MDTKIKCYRVNLYRIDDCCRLEKEKILKDSILVSWQVVGKIIIFINHGKVYEISTNYGLIRTTDYSSKALSCFPIPYFLQKLQVSYVVDSSEFIDANLVTLDEIMEYCSEGNSEWLEIYDKELRKSFPCEQEATLRMVKKLKGTYK